MKASRSEVYAVIDGERAYQKDRWEGHVDVTSGHTDLEDRRIDEWILYMEEYLSKARHASVHGDELEGLHMIRKVTSLGVACMEACGAPKREGY